MELLLVIQDGGHVSVVLSILVGALAIVEVDQHVGQVLVQYILNVVRVLLGLTSLLLWMMALIVLLLVLLG